MRSTLRAVACCGAVLALAPMTFAQQMTDEQLLQAYSDDGLSLFELSPEAVASNDCDISKAEREDCDAMLFLSSDERSSSKEIHAPWGLPQPTGQTNNEHLVINREYVIDYDDELHVPIWASYRLRDEDVVARTRRKCFRPDPRLMDDDSAALVDYVEPIYDRGHLVPRADMNRTKATMINTFVLSNMSPQTADFNQGIWQDLESMVRIWAVRKGTVYVITGAVFDGNDDHTRDDDADVDRVAPTGRLGVASHFYKIVLHKMPNEFIEAIAILLPHDEEVDHGDQFANRRAHIKAHITSIDEIEEMTGLDLLADLDDTKENAVEAFVAPDLWPLQGNN
jgi:endonuclease G, mitochondrial